MQIVIWSVLLLAAGAVLLVLVIWAVQLVRFLFKRKKD
jgi:hypothetical protein